MYKKVIVLILFGIAHLTTVAQNVEVSLEVKRLSSSIKSFTKEQMEKRLLDTVILSCRQEHAAFTNDIIFFRRDEAPNLKADYRLHLKVVDTLVKRERHSDVQMIMLYAKLYEARLPRDSVNKWMKHSGVSYGDSRDSQDITESEALSRTYAWCRTAANSILRDYLPLSLTKSLRSKNLKENQFLLQEYHRDVIITINSDDTDNQSSDDVKKIRTMVQNVFLRRQVFFYRATKLKKGYFNYYLPGDSIPLRVAGDNPIKVQFVISGHPSGYTIQVQSEDKQVVFEPSETTIRITKELLEKRPTWVNGRISSSVSSFIFNNLW